MDETPEKTASTAAKQEGVVAPCSIAPPRPGKFISLQMARVIAMDWHGGQWSALYALGSSGSLAKAQVAKCLAEVTACLKTEGISHWQAQRLRLLQAFISISYCGNDP